MAIPVQHHQSTQRSLYMCDISLFLVTIWHSSAPRVTICLSPSLHHSWSPLLGTWRQWGTTNQTRSPGFRPSTSPPTSFTTPVFRIVAIRIWIYMRILSSGMSPKKRQRVTWWKTSWTCSISSQYDRELIASVGIVSVHLRLKDSKIFYSWQGCWLPALEVLYQNPETPAKVKWNIDKKKKISTTKEQPLDQQGRGKLRELQWESERDERSLVPPRLEQTLPEILCL